MNLCCCVDTPKRAQLIANDRVRRRRPLLDAADVQGGGCEVDLLPSEIDQLAGPKAVAVGDKQHRGVAVAIAIALRGGVGPRVAVAALRGHEPATARVRRPGWIGEA